MRRFVRILAVAASLCLISPASAQAPASGNAGRNWVGAEKCATCHAAQAAAQARSGHARSLSRPASHPLAAQIKSVSGDWAFGAGLQAVTLVSRLDAGSYLEHGLSYYPAIQRLATTPGHADARGVRYQTFGSGGEILRCFLCHSTGTPSVSGAGEIQPHEPGVRCEVCHGPGGVHADAPSRDNILNPKRLSAADQNQMCGSCHRKPAAAGGDTDYRNPWNARHQPLYLARSRCFQRSLGSVSCLLCHPPHGGPASPDVCARCHEQPRHSPRTVAALGAAAAPRPRCETCHMPMVRPLEGLAFSNHWIGVYPPGETLVPKR